MDQLFKMASGISTIWSLAAFAIAAIVYFTQKQRGKVSSITWASVAAVVLMGLVPIAGSLYVQLKTTEITEPGRAIYRLRVNVVGPDGAPVSEAAVTNSLGDYATKAAGAWQFNIPATSRPADGRITVYATVEHAFLKGKSEVVLADDRNPATTVQLVREGTAKVRGIVVDEAHRAVSGARVSVVGYGSEAVTTKADGGFVLPAHAADGQQVELHVQKGSKAVTQWHPAGETPATIVLN